MMLERTGRKSAGLVLPRMPAGVIIPEGVAGALAAQPSILVVRAPRGAGKTSTVATWLRSADVRTERYCWLTLPNRAVSRDTFWTSVLKALGADYDGKQDPLAAVTHELERLRRPGTLVVDNFTQVEGPQVDDDLLDLLGQFPHLHLVILTRSERRLEALAEGFTGGVVLRMGDLLLTPEQVREMAEPVGFGLSLEEAERLVENLAGWPALIRAVLRDSSRSSSGYLNLDWSAIDRFLRVVLSDVEMWALTPVVMALSTPREFSQELASALVGKERSAHLLPILVDAALLERWSEEGHIRYRALPRIRDAVQSIYRTEDREAYAESHRICAGWFMSGGYPRESLDHAVEGEHWDTVTNLVERYWLEMLHRYPDQARSILRRIPEKEVRASARLLVARDYLLELDRWERWESAFRDGRMAPELASTHYSEPLSLAQTLSLRSGAAESSVPWPLDGLGRGPTGERWHEEILPEMPELLLQWSLTKLILGELVGAAYSFREAYRWADVGSATNAGRESACGLALSLALLGHITSAEGWLAVAQASGTEHEAGLEGVATKFVTMIGKIERAIDFGKPPPPPVGPVLGLPGVEVVDLTLRAAIALHAPASRLAVLREVEDSLAAAKTDPHAPDIAFAGLVGPVVDLYLATDNVEKARAVLEPFGTDHAWARVSKSRVALYDGSHQRALELTESYDELATTQIRHAMQLAVTRACAAWRLGIFDQAGDAFQHSLSLLEQTRNIRPFLLVPRKDLHEMAERFGGVIPKEFFCTIDDLPDVFPEPIDPVQLSKRELEVMRSIANGRPLSDAARRLYVTENTIKSQVRNIYRKLGVHSREDAIDRAKTLGLI